MPVVNSREHHHLANGTIFGTSVLCVHSLFSREICGVLLFLFFFHVYFHYFFFFCFFWFNVIRWFVQFSSFLLLENYRQEANVRIFLTFHCTYKWQWTCYIFFIFHFIFLFFFIANTGLKLIRIVKWEKRARVYNLRSIVENLWRENEMRNLRSALKRNMISPNWSPVTQLFGSGIT